MMLHISKFPLDVELTANFLTVNLPKTIDQLGDFVTSELGGNPPLWVTRQKNTHHDEIYINNAKVLMSHSNYVASKDGQKQVT